jgi:hypothetical protein
MATRTTNTTVTFRRPFLIYGLESVQPAGTYAVDTEEEQITGVSIVAWKRTSTVMRVSALGATEYVPIDLKDLKDALIRDAAAPELSEPSAATGGTTESKENP